MSLLQDAADGAWLIAGSPNPSVSAGPLALSFSAAIPNGDTDPSLVSQNFWDFCPTSTNSGGSSTGPPGLTIFEATTPFITWAVSDGSFAVDGSYSPPGQEFPGYVAAMTDLGDFEFMMTVTVYNPRISANLPLWRNASDQLIWGQQPAGSTAVTFKTGDPLRPESSRRQRVPPDGAASAVTGRSGHAGQQHRGVFNSNFSDLSVFAPFGGVGASTVTLGAQTVRRRFRASRGDQSWRSGTRTSNPSERAP